MNKWQNVVVTGPFIVTEYVPGSAATLVRNNNFFLKNPVGPGKGDQFPYLSAIKQPIIPDASTRQAALRTGKVDFLGNLSAEDATALKKTARNCWKKWAHPSRAGVHRPL